MKYDTPVYYQKKKKIMVRNVCKILKNPIEKSSIEKLIKHHDFPEEGTLSLTRLKVVRDSVEQSSDKTTRLLLQMC